MDYPKSVPGVGLVGGKFVDEDMATGRQGSLIPASWGNQVTDELLAVIEEAGLTPDEAAHDQLLDAINFLIHSAGVVVDERVAVLEAIPLPVGYKQTWKTVTANRAANTNHTNLTGRPIKVKVAAVGTTQADLLLFVDGELVDACNIYLGTSGGSQTGTVSEVVPAGSSYRYQASQGGLTSVWVKEMST